MHKKNNTMARFEAEELVASQLSAREGALQIGDKADGSVAIVGKLTVNSGSEAAFSFPQTIGQPSQVLTLDGSGGTQWAPGGGGGGAVTQIEAADTSCKVQCIDGGTVEMSNNTQTYFQSNGVKTQIASPSPHSAITLESGLSIVASCPNGIILAPGTGKVIISNYRLPNDIPLFSGRVMVSDSSGSVLNWKRPPAFTQSFGAGSTYPGQLLALNGTPTSTPSNTNVQGYRFIAPVACALSSVSIDVTAPPNCEIEVRSGVQAETFPVTGSPTAIQATGNLEFAAGDQIWVRIMTAPLTSGIVTCLFDWIIPVV